VLALQYMYVMKKEITTHKCYICKQIKPLKEFVGEKRRACGYGYRCKKCNNKVVRKNRVRRLSHNGKTINISAQQLQELQAKQDNKCGICGKSPNTKGLAVDHCHKTGLIRGLLCQSCNRGIGYLGDDIEMLEKALSYLKTAGVTGAEQRPSV
jgi:hypothetical protein